MSAHTGFLIVAAVSLAMTSPCLAMALMRRFEHRRLLAALFLLGYALIAQQFIVDAFINPPLFFHGFGPGIGIGLLIAFFGLLREDLRAPHTPRGAAVAHMRGSQPIMRKFALTLTTDSTEASAARESCARGALCPAAN